MEVETAVVYFNRMVELLQRSAKDTFDEKLFADICDTLDEIEQIEAEESKNPFSTNPFPTKKE